MMSEMFFTINPVFLWVTLAFLIIYLVLLVRALVEMIRLDAPTVIIVFTYISLIPFPLFLILGILNLIIWQMVRKDLLETQGG